MTFDNTTLSGLGLTLGTYTYTWGTGADADTYTVQIGASNAAPEPGSLAILGSGLLFLTARRRGSSRRRRA